MLTIDVGQGQTNDKCTIVKVEIFLLGEEVSDRLSEFACQKVKCRLRYKLLAW